MQRSFSWAILATALSLAVAINAIGQEPASAPAGIDGVIGAAQANLDRIDLNTIVAELARLQIIPASEAAEAKERSAQWQQGYAELPRLGARRLFIHLRASDVTAGGTTWGIECKDAASAAAVRGWVEGALKGAAQLPGDVPKLLPKHLAVEGRFVFGGPSAERLQAAIKTLPAPTDDQRQASDALMQADAGVMLFGDADSRRVIREMFPQLPAPFQEINGALLADGVRWTGVAVNFPPELKVAVNIETAKPDVATTLEQTVGKAMLLAKAFLTKESIDGPPVHQQRAKGLLPLLSLVAPKVDGTQLSITFGKAMEP